MTSLQSTHAMNIADAYIYSNTAISNSPLLSLPDIEQAYTSIQTIKASETPLFQYLGTNCMGMYQYMLYKNKTGKIYILTYYLQQITAYTEFTNEFESNINLQFKTYYEKKK
jgi:hypothetical protein